MGFCPSLLVKFKEMGFAFRSIRSTLLAGGAIMKPEISEFSYGFAITNELVGWAQLSAAPIFPSLVEEGRVGGGYDVKLDMPGLPLYLQFKRAERMTRNSAREISTGKTTLTLPYHRFHITDWGISDQHKLLLELDQGNTLVFYAAPRFHTLTEINSAWKDNSVASQSVFVAPRAIGVLDHEPHTVAYDRHKYESQPIRDSIRELAQNLADAEGRARERLTPPRRSPGDSRGVGRQTVIQTEETGVSASSSRIPTRSPAPLSEPNQILRNAADTASRFFGTQLIIVQTTG
jgi:hypothetical protein